jgi:hypothetical protein
MLIAALEEFVSQGVLQGSYYVWWIPFAVFLGLAIQVRKVVFRCADGWLAPLLYYVISGLIGLAVEWFIIGLAPWKDRESPLVLIVVFHSGMFSFWGAVALGPHILLDARPETARIRRATAIAFAVLMAVTYALALTAKFSSADQGVLFLACIGPILLTFLSMNGFYAWYFYRCREWITPVGE